jgi:hypothetical protein
MEATMTLREAIRAFRNADRLFDQAQAENQDLTVIENRKEDVRRYEALVEHLREQTTTYVVCEVSGEGNLSLSLDEISMLLQQGILYECDDCEEREDLDVVYGGDHREFHYAEGHNEYCASKALHTYDPLRWPEVDAPTHEYDTCKKCGTQMNEALV